MDKNLLTTAPTWTMVVAVSQNNVIGLGDALPWKLRSDLQRFKKMTMGHCLLMGRKTYESIGRPLPGRQTIVLTRNQWEGEGVQSVDDLSQVESRVEAGRQIMVVGGAQVYRAALDRCATLWLTRVLADVAGDTFLPTIDWPAWKLESSVPIPSGPHDEWPSEFQVWERSS